LLVNAQSAVETSESDSAVSICASEQ